MSRIYIQQATLVNEGKQFLGGLVIDNDLIVEILEGNQEPKMECDQVIDAKGLYLLPGVIDDHVHFREPGLTHKADILSESRAAAAGGVTSYMDMPNTNPLTTTLEALEEKFALAAQRSLVNYSFYWGATNNNSHLMAKLNKEEVCGIKLFMGSSTGNMLVDKVDALRVVFGEATLPIVAHCEDSTIINQNQVKYRELYGDDPSVIYHSQIRSEEACYQSTALAVQLAKETGARLHVAHLTTARELELFDPMNPQITSEICVAHLLFSDENYATLGTKIKCNPAIKTVADRDALRLALTDGKAYLVGTDHAPHLLEEKVGGCMKAVSGMPMLQFSLVSMLQLVNQGVLTLDRLVTLMCHHPADLFKIDRRGYLREGYKADLVLLKPDAPWTLTASQIESKCGWSPLEGTTFDWSVKQTFCNGRSVYANGHVNDSVRGEQLRFIR